MSRGILKRRLREVNSRSKCMHLGKVPNGDPIPRIFFFAQYT